MFRQDDRLVLEPVSRDRSLQEVLSELPTLDEHLPAIADPPVEPEDIFDVPKVRYMLDTNILSELIRRPWGSIAGRVIW